MSGTIGASWRPARSRSRGLRSSRAWGELPILIALPLAVVITLVVVTATALAVGWWR